MTSGKKLINNKSVYESEEIAFKEKLAYGLGDGATAFAAISVASFSMFYFTDYIGINATILGAILFFSRFFDAATNVIMGHFVDKTTSKHGKARPWVLWTIIPFAITLVLTFSIPTGWGEMATLVYIAVIVNVYFIAYTASNIPYGTLGSLISRNQNVRSDLNILRMISYFAMSIILGAITMPLVEMFGGKTISWTYVMILYAIAMSLVFLFTFRNTKERVQSAADAKEQENLSFGRSLKLVLTNKYWIILFFIILFAWSLLFMLNNVNVYYAEHILNNAKYVGALNTFFTGGLLVGFLTISFVIKRFGRRRTIIIGLIALIASSLLMLFDSTSLVLIGISSVIRGLGFSPIMGTAYAMLADVIDYGEWKNGLRNEGLTFAGGTFATTVGTGAASGGVGLFLGANGYISSMGATQPAAVYDAITFLFILAPAVLGVLLIILFYFYDLDTFYSKIVNDIRKRATFKN
ncbi:MFS transporter [Virgibacillus pantothenticus]|uniref:Sugar transporter n=1 Tax=Virgibacillus pantothenticus TaxID=1473 RepID=A0A0L0QVR6_VIRPA|nr:MULTISPECIES: glycoside-pentoside-hexuronide (GPH):cation symporter [Virgibacillus]API92432.1 MFS transporter [Virgibacillus sp. 6R]KNE22617.1 sugar transporter [Virgibacillus pantothenticus]MBS7427319.1 glycoside-pentoside-hexuronide (GPH):cation symporter [Virgibacillus sp. 19R1-5]MED3736998.1 glycoside-pentoside-hexuronide (GPH):cation symporter [Virgibacillus pantothenticus]QTY16629.1 MFS transporter [Virgibacillus pantothenticus]